MGNRLEDFTVSIYATDINQQALTQAKAGIYATNDIENVPRTILERYFTFRDGSYVVNSDIRRMVDLSYFDLVSTTPPPFVNLDLIFCCNFLIYLQRHRQERVIDTLYDSLNAPGYLVVGEVEALTGSSSKKLECLDNKARIYKKN